MRINIELTLNARKKITRGVCRLEKEYKVLKSKHIDTYHWHGSMFEYVWELTLKDLGGREKIKGRFYTDNDHAFQGFHKPPKGDSVLKGKTIIVKDDRRFDIKK